MSRDVAVVLLAASDVHRLAELGVPRVVAPTRIWATALQAGEHPGTQLEALLCEAERARAARMAPRRRSEFVTGRALVRALLGAARGEAPQALVLDVTRSGKPYVAGGPFFNVSHCCGALGVAVSTAHEVGLDLEPADRDVSDLAASFCSAQEQRRLAALAPPQRRALALRLWLRKEADLKQCGAGIGDRGLLRAAGAGPATRYYEFTLAGLGVRGALALPRSESPRA